MSLSRHSNTAKKYKSVSRKQMNRQTTKRGEKNWNMKKRQTFFLSLVDVIHYLMVLET